MVEHLNFFQSFDDMKVYHGNGQDIVEQALDLMVSICLQPECPRGRGVCLCPRGPSP